MFEKKTFERGDLCVFDGTVFTYLEAIHDTYPPERATVAHYVYPEEDYHWSDVENVHIDLLEAMSEGHFHGMGI